jgi:hypothetical protein
MSLLPDFGDLFQLAKKSLTVEEQQKFMIVWEELLKAKERIHELENEVKDLEEKLRIKGNIQYEAPVCWLKKEETKEKDGPFCQQCWEANGVLIHLQENDQGFLCTNCKNFFLKKGARSTIRGTGARGNLPNY